MKTKIVGDNAEAVVARFLQSDGFGILDRNWRTKVCEIDVIARKKKIVYFIEVKYRGGLAQGSGFEYIGPRKLNRLKFAVRVWCQNNNWEGDCRLVGAEVSGDDFQNIELIEIDQ